MKKYNLYTIFAIVLLLCSCDKFLDEVSQDEIVPKNLKDYSEFLYGEGYIRDTKVLSPYLDIMTDDAKCYYGKPSLLANDTRETGYGYYTWQEQPEYTLSGPLKSDGSWRSYYRYILISNIVSKDIKTIPGDESLRVRLEGEASMIRAFSYFMLVNLYAKPYEKSQASSTLGVPINSMTFMEDVKLQRATLDQNYNLILDNLEAAMESFKYSDNNKSIFRWNLNAARLFASRVHLYMRDYQQAIIYASEVLASSPALYDLNIKASDATTAALPFLNSSNPEILFSYGDYYISYFSQSANGCFPTSESLKGCYEKSDLRYGRTNGAFIREQGNFFGKQYTTFKGGSSSKTQLFGFALRTAEAYLNRAEAYAMLGKIDLALNDLNELRRFRIAKSSYTKLSSSSVDEVIELIKIERRREFCYEQHRWFDLRRWGMPEIVHEFVDEYNPYSNSTYVLNEGDDAYTLPIPVSVINYQPDIPNNDRPKRNKQ